MTTSNLHLTYRDGGTGDAGDPYTGLDRFGGLVETLWKKDTADKVRSKYGRNRLGSVTWRRDDEAHAQGVGTEDNLYAYDALQQVKARQRGSLTGTAPNYTGIANLQQQEGWTYDATGNWAAYSGSSPSNAQTRTHNKANEITQIASAPGAVAPTYDPVGNMLTLPKQPGLSAEQYDLVWDAWNRLVAVKDGETTVASYTYDGLTRRLTKTNASETRHYYYNEQWRAVEERIEVSGALIADRQYTWGLRDRWDLLRRKRSVSGTLNEVLYVLKDYLDPVAIVDGSGAVVERYAYDAFGNTRVLAPDFTARTASAYNWDFLFHAEFLDLDTGLYNYGYRYYSAALGRWPSRDPIGEMGGLNFYECFLNCAIQQVDTLGLTTVEQENIYSSAIGFNRGQYNEGTYVPGQISTKVGQAVQNLKSVDEMTSADLSYYLGLMDELYRRGGLPEGIPKEGRDALLALIRDRALKCCVDGKWVNKIPYYQWNKQTRDACINEWMKLYKDQANSDNAEHPIRGQIKDKAVSEGAKVIAETIFPEGAVATWIGRRIISGLFDLVSNSTRSQAEATCDRLVCPNFSLYH